MLRVRRILLSVRQKCLLDWCKHEVHACVCPLLLRIFFLFPLPTLLSFSLFLCPHLPFPSLPPLSTRNTLMMSHIILRKNSTENWKGATIFPCHVQAPSLSSASMIDTPLPPPSPQEGNPLSLGHTPLVSDQEAMSLIEAATVKLRDQKIIHTG